MVILCSFCVPLYYSNNYALPLSNSSRALIISGWAENIRQTFGLDDGIPGMNQIMDDFHITEHDIRYGNRYADDPDILNTC